MECQFPRKKKLIICKYSLKADKTEKTGEEKVYVKDEIERKINLDEKFHIILPNIYNVPSPKGKKVWGHYKEIKKVRDRIIHLKSIDRKASGPEDETIWGIMLSFLSGGPVRR